MTVLVTGADGYIGWPTALRIADRTHQRVILTDNFARRRWVQQSGGVSATDIVGMDERLTAAKDSLSLSNLSFVEGDLVDREFVAELLNVHEPQTVVHAAAQPSPEYSQINGERANYTQHNNLQATRNLLFGLHEHGLADTHFIETTTTGIYGAPTFPIPEGGAVMENQGDRDEVPFPGMAGSWYHLTKCHDAANIRLANTQFGLPISDVRTAIVYGASTGETRADDRLATRLDFEYYFGTVANRFCAQAVAGYPVTVYGQGEQRKPFVSLEDTVEGLAQLALVDPEERPDPLTVYNQVTRSISIVEIAQTIADVAAEYGIDASVEHFENPRDEDETHKMEIENQKYDTLIGGQSVSFESGMRDMLDVMTERSGLVTAHDDLFLPSVLESER